VATKYRWTTGSISSSLSLDHVQIEILNNTSRTRSATVDFYDLTAEAPIITFTENIIMAPFSNKSIKVAHGEATIWEAQVLSNSKSVRIWVGGQDDAGMNLIGNVVLSSQLQISKY
jgi:hypothetical protein